MVQSRQNHDNNRDNLKFIYDAVEDLIMEIAWDVYERSDSIHSEACEGLLDDDVDEVEMNARDIIQEMIKEKMNDR